MQDGPWSEAQRNIDAASPGTDARYESTRRLIADSVVALAARQACRLGSG
jgi:hypothetical protein